MVQTEKSRKLLDKIVEYRNRAFVTRRCQYLAANSSERKNFWFGIPVVIITALVGTSIFGSLQENPNANIKIVVGVLSICATVLAALQTYLGFGEKAAKHKEAGARYACIWRSLDLIWIELDNKGDEYSEEAIGRLRKVVEELDEAGQKSPNVADKAYNLAMKELREKIRERKFLNTEESDAVAPEVTD